jgi:hypothetical protein
MGPQVGTSTLSQVYFSADRGHPARAVEWSLILDRYRCLAECSQVQVADSTVLFHTENPPLRKAAIASEPEIIQIIPTASSACSGVDSQIIT